jgi:predicted N-acetyltransferase YhbS
MPDLLVNLLNIPPSGPSIDQLRSQGINIRRARAFELSKVQAFVQSQFSTAWADEISVGFSRQPVSVFIATYDRRVIGFAASECTARGFFGPTGVVAEHRGKGIGEALLFATLRALRELGYVYAIIGAAGPIDFYQTKVGATVIESSEPGFYDDLLDE